MEPYKGKSKCSCGKRAKYRVLGHGHNHFACEDHKARIEGIKSIDPSVKENEADNQTWKRL